MRRSAIHPKVLFLLVSLLCLLAASNTLANGRNQIMVAAKLAEAIQHYDRGLFNDGLSIAGELLKMEELTDKDMVAIYSVLGMLTYAKGNQYHDLAYEYLKKIVAVNPCVIDLPEKFWAQQLCDQWCKIADSAGQLICEGERDSTIITIAIMEFDRAATKKEYYENLGYITAGLQFFFNSDFEKISSIRVVDRNKIDHLLREKELVQAGFIDKSTAIEVGKIMGAHYMIFGMIQQESHKHCTMGVQVINVETSEHVLSASVEGKPEFFKMREDLVKEIANKLDLKLDRQTEKAIKDSGTESNEAATLYSKGVFYMCEYDYGKAYEYFKKAYEADNNFKDAKEKMDLYRPLAL